METEKIIDIYDISKGEIKKCFNKNIAIQATVIMVIGLALMWLASQSSDQTTVLYMAAMTVGVIVFVIGTVRMFAGARKYVYVRTKSPLKTTSLYFAAAEELRLRKLIAERRFNEILNLKREENQGVRLDVLFSEDKKFAAMQVFTYIPYAYQATESAVAVASDQPLWQSSNA